MNALTTAKWGLTSAEHYYGLPESLFEDRVIQPTADGFEDRFDAPQSVHVYEIER